MARTLRSPDLVWPLSVHDVENALGPLGEQVEVSWASWHRKPARHFLEAGWTPLDGGLVGAAPGAGASLWVRPVRRPMDDFARAAAMVALEAAAQWLQVATAAGDAWQASRHTQLWTLP